MPPPSYCTQKNSALPQDNQRHWTLSSLNGEMTQPTGRPSQPEPVISFTSILSRVREAYPELPLDPVILQSVLLCLIAGRYDQYHGEGSETHKGKNLLLRTRKDDVGMVLSVTAMVSADSLFVATVR